MKILEEITKQFGGAQMIHFISTLKVRVTLITNCLNLRKKWSNCYDVKLNLQFYENRALLISKWFQTTRALTH